MADRLMVAPPSCLVTLGVISKQTTWLLKKALYGLRDSRKCWQIHGNKCLKELEWKVGGRTRSLRQSITHGSVWTIVKGKADPLRAPNTRGFGSIQCPSLDHLITMPIIGH
eukprot:4349611-Amphidinium_carterae.1